MLKFQGCSCRGCWVVLSFFFFLCVQKECFWVCFFRSCFGPKIYLAVVCLRWALQIWSKGVWSFSQAYQFVCRCLCWYLHSLRSLPYFTSALTSRRRAAVRKRLLLAEFLVAGAVHWIWRWQVCDLTRVSFLAWDSMYSLNCRFFRILSESVFALWKLVKIGSSSCPGTGCYSASIGSIALRSGGNQSWDNKGPGCVFVSAEKKSRECLICPLDNIRPLRVVYVTLHVRH